MKRTDDYIRPRGYYDNQGNLLNVNFQTVNDALSGITVSAAQINFSTSFPASAAYAVSANYSVSASTAAYSTSAGYAISCAFAVSASTSVNATTALAAASATYAVSAGTAAQATTAVAAASAGYAASAGSLGLTTSMWKDLIMPGVNLGVGASAPDMVTLTGNILARGFDGGVTTEQLYGSFEMQHDYKEGTDIRPHIHWCPADTSTGEVVWNMEYSVIPVSGTAGTATTLTVTSTANGTQNSHTKKEFGIVSGSMQVGTIMAFRVYRDPTLDTYTGDSILLDMGLHYEVSSLGSINIYGN